MGWVLNETDYICCFDLSCTCQYNKLIELELQMHIILAPFHVSFLYHVKNITFN